MMMLKLLILIAIINQFDITNARSVNGLKFRKRNGHRFRPESVKMTLWEPDVGSRKEWLQNHGMAKDKWQSILDKMRLIEKMQSDRKHGPSRILSLAYEKLKRKLIGDKLTSPPQEEEKEMGCMLYTQEQIDEELDMITEENQVSDQDLEGSGYVHEEMATNLETQHPKRHNRQKRKAEDFERRPSRKWNNPILFTFDGSHNDEERQIIKNAIKHWEDRTCLKFFEVGATTPLKQQHLMFTKEPNGCYSFVGKTGTVPQQINLAESCLGMFGIPIHEIGHALGLWHEQQRSDRDAWITVNRDNVGYYSSQYWKRRTVSLGVPYDYGSVMHYTTTAGAKNRNLPTMESIDPMYQKSMGQRTELSYMDAKIVNMMYCEDDCSGRPLPRACERGGYQDPDSCGRCVCPDGFGGRYCEGHAQPSNVECGGVIELNDNGEEQIIESPGYSDVGHYDDFTECSWIIKAPDTYKVSLTFDENDEFAVYCRNSNVCFHWVEVKYKTDFEYPGPRLCCYNKPDYRNFTSEESEMVVIFKSNFPTSWKNVRKGFRAHLTAVSPDMSDENTNEEKIETETSEESSTSTTIAPPLGIAWGPWSECAGHDCHCGGCSQQTRHKMCSQKICRGDLEATETRPCAQKCSPDDTFLQYTGKFIKARCPMCCTGFDLKDERCVPQ